MPNGITKMSASQIGDRRSRSDSMLAVGRLDRNCGGFSMFSFAVWQQELSQAHVRLFQDMNERPKGTGELRESTLAGAVPIHQLPN